jgi:hypothetical protein
MASRAQGVERKNRRLPETVQGLLHALRRHVHLFALAPGGK